MKDLIGWSQNFVDVLIRAKTYNSIYIWTNQNVDSEIFNQSKPRPTNNTLLDGRVQTADFPIIWRKPVWVFAQAHAIRDS